MAQDRLIRKFSVGKDAIQAGVICWQELCAELERHTEDRSEEWQESEKGQAYTEVIETLEAMIEQIEACLSEDPDLESL